MYFCLEFEGQQNLKKLYPNKNMWHCCIVDNEGENAIDSRSGPCVLVALTCVVEALS